MRGLNSPAARVEDVDCAVVHGDAMGQGPGTDGGGDSEDGGAGGGWKAGEDEFLVVEEEDCGRGGRVGGGVG